LVIPALRRLRQEELKFEVNPGYIVRSCLRKEGKEEQNPLCPLSVPDSRNSSLWQR
jgi:hypothetical protein